MLNPVSLVAFCVVVFWAFIVEAGIVTLLLAFRGVVVLRMFFCYYMANALVFFLVFQPVLEQQWMPVFALESAIVMIDAVIIKFLTTRESLQGDNYQELTWRGAVIISAIENTLSYLSATSPASVRGNRNCRMANKKRDASDYKFGVVL